jgi:hypothetical protein
MHLEESEGTDGNESQNGADTVTARDNDNIVVGRLSVLAHSRLDEGDNVKGAVSKADGVSLLAGLDNGTGSIAAGLVDSSALNTALLVGARLGTVVASVTLGLGARVITLAVVASVALRLGASVVSVLANSGLDVGGNIEGAVTKADGVLALAGLNVVAVNGAALIVDSGALNTALLLRARLGTFVASVTLGLGARVLVLADSRLDIGDNVEGVVSEADSVLLLADLNVTLKAALIVDSSALDAALLDGNLNLLVTRVVLGVVTLGLVTRVVLADSRLDIGDNVEGVVSEADSVLLLADLNVTLQAALVVDSSALNTALLNSNLNLLVAVVVVLGVVVVLSVAGLVLLVVRLFVLADRGLDVRDNVEGAVAKADSVLLLADSDIGTGDGTALIVDGSALEAAVFSSVVTLVVGRGGVRRRRVVTRLVVRAVLLVEVVLVILGLVVNVVLLLVLANRGLGVRDNIPWVVTEADSVLLLADSDISARNGTALVVNGGTFVGADVRGEAASSAANALAIVVLGRVRLILADRGLDVGNDVPWVVTQADSVSLLADGDVSTGNGTTLVVDGGTLVAADLRAGTLGGLDHGGHCTSRGGGVNDGIRQGTGN